MKLTEEIRERLKSAMLDKKMTGYKINKKTNISATTVGNYLNGIIEKADNNKLEPICKLLDITMEWLEFGQDIVKTPKEEPMQPVENNIESILKQIYLQFKAKDDQYINLHKETHSIHNEMEEIKKDFQNVQKELNDLKIEIQKLGKK